MLTGSSVGDAVAAGTAVSAAGDADADNRDDVAFSLPGYSLPGNLTRDGRVLLMTANQALNLTEPVTDLARYAQQLLRDEGGNLARDLVSQAGETARIVWRLPTRVDSLLSDLDDGTVAGVAAGTVTITGTFEGQSDSVSITVEAAEVTVTGLEVNASATTMSVGATVTVTATATYSDGTTAAVTPTWSSSDAAGSRIASTWCGFRGPLKSPRLRAASHRRGVTTPS